MRKIIGLIIIIPVLFTLPAFSADKMRIAVMEFKAEGVSVKIARVISNMVRTDLVKMDKFIVVERTQMDAIMKEQGLQMTGCTDESCAVQVGRLMSANKMLIGEVGSMGRAIVITVRIVDVEKGVSEFAEKETAPSEYELSKSVNKLTERLSATIEEAMAVKIPSGYYLRGFVPGWGQFYAGNSTRGYLYSGGFAAAVLLAMLAQLNYSSKQSDYEDLPAGAPQSTYDDKYNASKQAGYFAGAAIGLVGIIYIANWVDILFFTKEVYYREAGLSQPSGWYVGITAESCCYDNNNSEQMIKINLGYRF
jgi:TolB-like protein